MSATTLGQDFARIIGRDLDKLAGQIASYPDDASVWTTGGTIKNSAGTLAVHLVGNLEHFVGAVLGDTGYVRDRELEFSERGVTRDEIVGRIAHCQDTVLRTLAELDDATLAGAYPGALPPVLEGAATRLFLLHLTGHLGWHLGQVDYHRRILVERGEEEAAR